MATIRVVVIDDVPATREAVTSALGRDPDIEVVGAAPDGASGLQLAQNACPDVVVCDLYEREMGGIPLLQHLRRCAPHAKVLVHSAQLDPESIDAAVSAGATGYVPKHDGVGGLRNAVIALHAGGTAVAPSLAGALVQRIVHHVLGHDERQRPRE